MSYRELYSFEESLRALMPVIILPDIYLGPIYLVLDGNKSGKFGGNPDFLWLLIRRYSLSAK